MQLLGDKLPCVIKLNFVNSCVQFKVKKFNAILSCYFFSLVAKRLSSYFYSSMEVVFRCLLKKNKKKKQSRHGRKELLTEGKKRGGVNKNILIHYKSDS